jgi:hypothetical protein
MKFKNKMSSPSKEKIAPTKEKIATIEEVIPLDPSVFLLSMITSSWKNWVYDEEFGLMVQNVKLLIDIGNFKKDTELYQLNILPLKDKSIVISILEKDTDSEDKWIDHAFKVNCDFKPVNVKLVGGEVNKEKDVVVHKN